jgi:hypothetical protein
VKNIKLKRAYDDPVPSDGIRILVDRLWPRGLKKEAAAIDCWAKDSLPAPLYGSGSTTTQRGGQSLGVAIPRRFANITDSSIEFASWRDAIRSRSSTPRATKSTTRQLSSGPC